VKPIVNDFNIQVATVNGSGSQTANTVLLRAIFQMGIPVSGKNLFPSNIAGLPTWFTIRVSRDGYVARRRETDLTVIMNPETAEQDARAVGPGGVIVLNDQIALPELPEDRVVYAIPMQQLITAITTDVRLRRLVVNMLYVGVLAELLGIAEDEIERALDAQLGHKPKALALNHQAVRAGWEWARENLKKRDPFRLERMNETRGKILIDGNTAAGMGAMFGGVTVVTWYPITPSSSLVEALIGFLERYRRDPETGENSYAVVQAEDEIAAIGMVLGAGWAGARAMTSTSGPGLSLMTEFVGYGYFAEIPAVIWDIQRIGPSTGLPTRTAQGDLTLVATMSHGDTRHPVLLPSSVADCFAFAMKAFDLAERLQTPVFVLSDLDLGMNNWMSDPFDYPAKPWDRGKVLDAEALAKLEKFERYRDVDGDGIPWRTLPGGDSRGAYFTRGSGHDEAARYTEDGETYRRVMDRLARKYETARALMPAPVVEEAPGAEVGILAFGSSHWAVIEARDQLRAQGVDTSYLLLKALPFHAEVERFLERHPRVYVVEQNRDGQLAGMLRAEYPALATRVRSVLHYVGLPIDARSVTDGVVAQERGTPSPAAGRAEPQGVSR